MVHPVYILVLRPCQAASAPNVPHDIAAKREEEEWLLGTMFCLKLWNCQERAFLF